MKKIITTSTLLFLFAFSIFAATPQQSISPEKKSAMHNLDPVDIFPQARERSGPQARERSGPQARERSGPQARERSGKENKRSANSSKSSLQSVSANLANNSSEPETGKKSRRNSRRRHSSEDSAPASEDNAPTGLVAIATPTPVIENSGAQPEPAATATPDSNLSLAETNSKKPDTPPQTLASMSNLPEGEGGTRNRLLSLPVILALLAIVLIALVLVFAKLLRFLRGPAV